MLIEIAGCPYCGSRVFLDSEERRIVGGAEYGEAPPCPHLACTTVGLEVWRLTADGAFHRDPEGSIGLLWTCDRGEYPEDEKSVEYFDLVDYIVIAAIAPQGIKDGPTSMHQIAGASASEREERDDEDHDRPIGVDGLDFLYGSTVDGWANFGPDPVRVLEELRQVCVGCAI